MRRLAAVGMALALALPLALVWPHPPAAGHEPMDADTAAELLARVDALSAVAGGAGPAAERARATFDLGEHLARIVDLLNGDLAHHRELGLAASIVAKELERRGLALDHWPQANRFRRYLRPFEDYLAMAPAGPKAAEARFRVLSGRFYDSFAYDPLRPVGLEWPALRAAIGETQDFLARHADDDRREEAQFILAVDYLRAARLAPDPALADAYAEKARAALAAFPRRYPQSPRAAAAKALATTLPAAD